MRNFLFMMCLLLLQACVHRPSVGPIANELQAASSAKLFLLEQEKRTSSFGLSSKDLQQLARVAGLAQVYVPNASKGCLPQYGAEVAFDSSMSVLFCMQCRILQVRRGDEVVFTQDFEPWCDDVVEVLGQHVTDIRSVR